VAVAVLRALGLGDFLTALPALRALRDAFPSERLTLAAPAALAPLVRHAGAADDLVDVDYRQGFAPLPPELQGVDVAVNLHGCGADSHRVLLDAHPQRLIAFRNAAVGVDGPAWDPDEHEVARWCRLLRESGIAADRTRLDLSVPVECAPARVGGATIVHPGAGVAGKRWPAARWAAVAAGEQRAGRHVVLTGSADEAELGARVAADAGLPPERVLAGRTDLEELAAAVSVAGRVVSCDTGIAHLATALGTPSVVLFGPVPPHRWAPPADRPQHRVLYAGPDGLARITPDDVLTALAALPRAVSVQR
jgi:ADP-heptose:LPS heptosyltransferase